MDELSYPKAYRRNYAPRCIARSHLRTQESRRPDRSYRPITIGIAWIMILNVLYTIAMHVDALQFQEISPRVYSTHYLFWTACGNISLWISRVSPRISTVLIQLLFSWTG